MAKLIYPVMMHKTQAALEALWEFAPHCGATVSCFDQGSEMRVEFEFSSDDRTQGGDYSFLMASLDDREALGQYLVDHQHIHYDTVLP